MQHVGHHLLGGKAAQRHQGTAPAALPAQVLHQRGQGDEDDLIGRGTVAVALVGRQVQAHPVQHRQEPVDHLGVAVEVAVRVAGIRQLDQGLDFGSQGVRIAQVHGLPVVGADGFLQARQGLEEARLAFDQGRAQALRAGQHTGTEAAVNGHFDHQIAHHGALYQGRTAHPVGLDIAVEARCRKTRQHTQRHGHRHAHDHELGPEIQAVQQAQQRMAAGGCDRACWHAHRPILWALNVGFSWVMPEF